MTHVEEACRPESNESNAACAFTAQGSLFATSLNDSGHYSDLTAATSRFSQRSASKVTALTTEGGARPRSKGQFLQNLILKRSFLSQSVKKNPARCDKLSMFSYGLTFRSALF